VIPIHGNQNLKIGLLRSLMKIAGLNESGCPRRPVSCKTKQLPQPAKHRAARAGAFSFSPLGGFASNFALRVERTKFASCILLRRLPPPHRLPSPAVSCKTKQLPQPAKHRAARAGALITRAPLSRQLPSLLNSLPKTLPVFRVQRVSFSLFRIATPWPNDAAQLAVAGSVSTQTLRPAGHA
jgi:hypothetical protein